MFQLQLKNVAINYSNRKTMLLKSKLAIKIDSDEENSEQKTIERIKDKAIIKTKNRSHQKTFSHFVISKCIFMVGKKIQKQIPKLTKKKS